MTKMSKALTDVLSISGDSKDIKSLLKIMKDNGIKIVSVKCPKKGQTAQEINDFIDKKWKVTKFNVYSNKVLVATKKPSHIYIVYGNRNLTYSLRATGFTTRRLTPISCQISINSFTNGQSFGRTALGYPCVIVTTLLILFVPECQLFSCRQSHRRKDSPHAPLNCILLCHQEVF